MMLAARTNNKTMLWFTIISVVILVLFCVDILLGSVNLPFGGVIDALLGTSFMPDININGEEYDVETVRSIVMKFRLPKALVAVTAGAALSSSGLQMQTLFRNPLAGPFVLGISSGASLGVALFLLGMPVFGITMANGFLQDMGIVGAAWLGAAAVLSIIIAVSVRLKDIMAILILGMMLGSAITALVEMLQYLSPEGALKSFVVWTMGSLGGVTSKQLYILLPVCGLGLLFSIFLIKPLNILLLGENYARTMGMNVKFIRVAISVTTILLAGTITAFCGPIGFIGIAVPHIARMLFAEADHRVLMPASMLIGAAVMLFSDIVAQVPGHDITLPINTITALLGVPVVIMVVVRNRKVF